MISYYELLGMIKEDKAPKEIRVHLTNTPRIYKKDDDTEEYCYYVLENEKEENENYKYYLMESYMESMIFDETIEIIEEEKKIPKKLDIQIQNETAGNVYITNEQGTKCYLTKHSKIIAERLNQVIDYLKSKGE